MTGRLIYSILISILLLNCSNDEGFDNPHYPAEPSIKFKNVTYTEVPIVLNYQTLKVTFRYKDGDSDLGLDSKELNYPYNDAYYFLEDGSGDTARVTAEHVTIEGTPAFLLNPIPLYSGKLVTSKTRLNPNYEFLPEYDPDVCGAYSTNPLIVSEESALIDESYNVTREIISSGKKYFVVQEKVLYERNQNYYNIFVELYTSTNGATFTKLDIETEYCMTFNGRFPYIGEETGTSYSAVIQGGTWLPFKVVAKTPWEGEISYKIINPSLKALLSNKQLKVKIYIKDRALHASNVVESPVFTLDEINEDN